MTAAGLLSYVLPEQCIHNRGPVGPRERGGREELRTLIKEDVAVSCRTPLISSVKKELFLDKIRQTSLQDGMGWQDCIVQKRDVEQEMRLVDVTVPKNLIPPANSVLGVLFRRHPLGLKRFYSPTPITIASLSESSCPTPMFN